MVRTLIGEGVPNITQPTAEYPFGKYKDKTSSSSNDGTELSERTLGDCYQGMLNTITRTGATPNNQPETALTSQFADAVELLKPVGVAVVGSNDDGATFKVLTSKVRDPKISFAAGCITNDSESQFLSANFQILRNNVLDTTHNYIVTVSPAYKFAGATLVTIALTPRVFVAHNLYFNNMNIYLSNLSNLFFEFSQGVQPTDAKALARAVLTIYDAGPVS